MTNRVILYPTKDLDTKEEMKDFGYETLEEKWLVPVYRSQPDPEKPGHYLPLEVVGLANLSNPSEPLERIFFVSNS